MLAVEQIQIEDVIDGVAEAGQQHAAGPQDTIRFQPHRQHIPGEDIRDRMDDQVEAGVARRPTGRPYRLRRCGCQALPARPPRDHAQAGAASCRRPSPLRRPRPGSAPADRRPRPGRVRQRRPAAETTPAARGSEGVSTIDHSPRAPRQRPRRSPGSSTGCPPPPDGSRLRGCRLVHPSSYPCGASRADFRGLRQARPVQRPCCDGGLHVDAEKPALLIPRPCDHGEGHRNRRLQLRLELREAVPVLIAMLTEVLDDPGPRRAMPRRSRTAARGVRTCAPAAPPARPGRRCRSPASPAMIRCG